MNESQIVDYWNSIEWRKTGGISATAMDLIQLHLTRMREVVNEIRKRQDVSAIDAHGIAITAGADSEEYAKVMDALFTVDFTNAMVREPIILVISSCYCWDVDPDLCKLQNPWQPLVDLLKLGYTTSFDDDFDSDNVTLMVGHKTGIERFALS
jgi:hypothetical protein